VLASEKCRGAPRSAWSKCLWYGSERPLTSALPAYTKRVSAEIRREEDREDVMVVCLREASAEDGVAFSQLHGTLEGFGGRSFVVLAPINMGTFLCERGRSVCALQLL
jgi:hypothetical protein